jgi:hypothetical protein
MSTELNTPTTELNTITCQPEVTHARAKDLDAASDAKLALICGEMTAGEIRTLRAMLSYILRPPAEEKLKGFQRMANALEIVRKYNQDVEQWMAQHIGHLRDDREKMEQQIYNLKRRVSRIEKALTEQPDNK